VRPILSDSEPKTMKNGVPDQQARAAIIRLAVAGRPEATRQEKQQR